MPKIDNQLPGRSRALWTLLRWEGELRNDRVRHAFGLQKVQASRLIAAFADANPGVVRWVARERRWVLNEDRLVLREGGKLEEYVALVPPEHRTPVIHDARADFGTPEPRLLAVLTQAARTGTGVSLTYRSMTSPAGAARVIYPTALVRLSQRWHVRAWCAERREYRDFNLGRMSGIKPALDANRKPLRLPAAAGADQDWETVLTVRVGAHEALGPDEAAMVRHEYFRGTSARRLMVRAALVHYVLQEVRVAIRPAEERPPAYLLQLLNPDEIGHVLFRSVERRKGG